MSNSLRWIVAVGALALALSGCGATDDADSGKPKVLTTFTVVADMVRQVGGDRIEVASITKPGAEIHGYEPTPSDLKNAATSDLVLQNGMGLERWFEQFVDLADAKSVTLSTGVQPIPIAGESEYAGKPNPHAWMSVSNAKIYVENIRKALTDLDPAGAAVYAANAREYSGALDEVGALVKRELAALPPQRRALVSCEGAFSYMARDFGLTEQYLWPVNAEQEGTPQQIAGTVNFVRERQVPAVFCESTVSDEAMKQVANESGARFAGALYVDSLSQADGPVPTYLDLLRRDAQTIIAGLTGAST
ncbi:metal ABC transporter substrate-binding protein [Solirubrobacter sp. CPCC 204708]|uniref:Metal ABC transporter substrate-binding protein n=1 Tax=Solirubrobacter deserti TaxID=2282478 RepID=A0ABT4RMV6_9ACTN|nr:metal ABC transporter substrate-binding protein [Solirubrobacter deserti]MBE2320127.1 metal ABC transporter substrate-binding protein [Solirubrobacter deserti]MDA0139847.1 metal ABC transporter substrate-binding protein [Solirubrobacter deserti]